MLWALTINNPVTSSHILCRAQHGTTTPPQRSPPVVRFAVLIGFLQFHAPVFCARLKLIARHHRRLLHPRAAILCGWELIFKSARPVTECPALYGSRSHTMQCTTCQSTSVRSILILFCRLRLNWQVYRPNFYSVRLSMRATRPAQTRHADLNILIRRRRRAQKLPGMSFSPFSSVFFLLTPTPTPSACVLPLTRCTTLHTHKN